MEKKCICRLWYGRKSRKYPKVTPCRYVSSAELVGDDIVIHTSLERVTISEDLAEGAGSVFGSCANSGASWEVSWLRDYDPFDESCLPEVLAEYVKTFGEDGLKDLIARVRLKVVLAPEVPGNE